MSTGAAAHVATMLPLRLPFGKPVSFMGPSAYLTFVPADRVSVEEPEPGCLKIALPPTKASELAADFARTGSLRGLPIELNIV